MNNTTHITLGLFSLIIGTFSMKAAPVATPEQPTSPNDITSKGPRVVMIDDQTGEELARDHGIQPLAATDLYGLLKSVIQGKLPVDLYHLSIDENVSDNPMSKLVFNPYQGNKAPSPPSINLPMRQLRAKTLEYRKLRKAWQIDILKYHAKLKGEVDGFLVQVTNNQNEVAERFDKLLLERQGADFNRSDIVGSIIKANELMSGAEIPVIIFNSDCVDRPGHRKPHGKALTTKELDPKVTLIFVNTSRKPEQNILFQGLKNPVLHADNMNSAMNLVVDMLKEKP